jgi:S1-C subfamily serine protease
MEGPQELRIKPLPDFAGKNHPLSSSLIPGSIFPLRLRMRPLFVILAIVIASSFCHAGARANTPSSLAERIHHVRSSVVQIAVQLVTPTAQVSDIPCFRGRTCIAGTGVFINDRGDVVTAYHVISDINHLRAVLNARHIESEQVVGVEVPNLESAHLSEIGNVITTPFVFNVEDSEKSRDLVVISTSPRLLRSRLSMGPGTPSFTVTAAKLDVARPNDGEEVFVSGFPLGQESLITTAGYVATAWGSEILVTARNNGIYERSDVYRLDLRLNFGNSGGPVFRKTSQGVTALVLEMEGNPGSYIGTAIPSRYIAEMLNKRKIPWQRVQEAKHTSSQRAQR